MKALLGAPLGVLLLAHAIAGLDIAPLGCTDGSSWNDGCNQCQCLNGVPACTLRACPAGPREGSCVEGSRWSKDGCNWCNCVNGRGVCTRRACPPQLTSLLNRGRSADAAQTQDDEAECAFTGSPADRWLDECNWCRCGRNGTPQCTRKGCPPIVVERLEGTKQCEGKARWRKGCNWCECVDNFASCTEKACSDDGQVAGVATPAAVSPREPDCEVQDPEKDRWRSDCNWCRCTEGGLGVCTLRGCPEALKEQLIGQPQCEGQARWRVDKCNWCTCSNGVGVCTKKACSGQVVAGPPQLVPVARSAVLPVTSPSSEPTCEAVSEDGRWRKNCNWCRCLDGQSACTKRGCPPSLRDELSSTPQCEGSVRWKKDCNWCSCVDGVGICTLRACFNREDFPALNRSPAPTGRSVSSNPEPDTLPDPMCVAETPGARYKMDCNWCWCTSNGFGMCTLIGCVAGPNQRDSQEPECEGKLRWKKDCNWCSCVNGRGVCTRRACPKGQ